MLRIFGNTAGFDRVGSVSFICTVVKSTSVTCIYNPQIHKFAMCSKDVAITSVCHSWEDYACRVVPRVRFFGVLCNVLISVDSISFLAFWEYDCFPKIYLSQTSGTAFVEYGSAGAGGSNPEPFSLARDFSLICHIANLI